MWIDDQHISDQELLQAADGELPSRRAAEVRDHLAACWHCRARMGELEGTIGDFVRGHREAFDALLPSTDGPRALLRARLAGLEHEAQRGRSIWLSHLSALTRSAALVAFLVVAVITGWLVLRTSWMRAARSDASNREALPEHALTPGMVRTVALSDVCAMPHEEVVRPVSASLRDQVLRQYGIRNAHPDEYEIDWLIAPGLGGAEDIHNLWPEPSEAGIWNAGVKDDLEERLHQMVCSGNLDLSTAQHDISSNWIAAYQKYFHTTAPLAAPSRAGISTHSRAILIADSSLVRAMRISELDQ